MSRETDALLKALEAVQFHVESLLERSKYHFSTVTALPIVKAQERADRILDRFIEASKVVGMEERAEQQAKHLMAELQRRRESST